MLIHHSQSRLLPNSTRRNWTYHGWISSKI